MIRRGTSVWTVAIEASRGTGRRRAKIVCTLGPASSDPSTLRAMVEAGMDVARINTSYARPEDHAATIAMVADAAPTPPKARTIRM